MTNYLQFSPVSSYIQSSFWNKFVEIKINIDKLNESEHKIWGYFSNNWPLNVLEVDSTSFNLNSNDQNNCILFHGKIFNKNTIEQFKNIDKTVLINEEGHKFFDNIKNGTILQIPSMLNNFFVLSFSDLKKYHFYYWFAFPVPHNFKIIINNTQSIDKIFNENEISSICEQFKQLDSHQKCYFIIEKSNNEFKLFTLNSKLKDINENIFDNYYFGFLEFNKNIEYPRSQLKNFILLILYYCPFLIGKKVNFIQYIIDSKSNITNKSKIFPLIIPIIENINEFIKTNWVGWEKNEQNKLTARFSNMKASMDPEILFEESVDINLKLMKWRLLPNVDLEKIKKTKFLLLGAGTLGCSVARTLLGWGARNINLLDNSIVSFSNPTRQILFNYDDSIKGLPKAEAAANNLKKIFPSLNSEGIKLTIPMPGHSLSLLTYENVKKDVEKLERLIEESDVIFLLTDSRESRWLPTLLGCYFGKIIINSALGFDSYLVMRYGGVKNEEPIKSPSGFHAISGSKLSCYFCNDVTAPGDSMKDRTLDQQCTVTRPGVSPIAGALAVELAISIIQHPKGINAPAFYKIGNNDLDLDLDENGGILGLIPHSIRGFLANFSQVLPATQKYNQCTACSEIVLNEYKEKKFEFLNEVFNSSKYLEDLTGLSELKNENNILDVLELSDDDLSQ